MTYETMTYETLAQETMTYEDIRVKVVGGVARLTIDRPDVLNAFRARTCEELIHALGRVGWDPTVGVIVLAGAGEKAFSTGGDLSAHGDSSGTSAAQGQYDGRGTIGLPIEEMHSALRDVPKPVIARVQGYAIGGGNVLAALCDLTLASERAVFGQVGPKVGSADPGFGTAYLARVVGEKRAREMWFFCRRYSAREALEMGLVNAVVPHEELDAELDRWCQDLLDRSPTALALVKRSINADSDSIRGLSALGMQAVSLYYQTEEAREGVKAFAEKRPPDFRQFRR